MANQQAQEDVEALSYTVSHDLRSPLGAILNFSALLQEEFGDRLNDEGRDWLARIDRNARQAVAMMDSLLVYSRVGRAPFSEQQLDLGALVRGVFAEELDPNQSNLARLIVEDLPAVSGDPQLVRQLFVEVLRNSIEFSCNGDCEIRVYAVCTEDGVQVIVQDNGPGFELPDPERAFRLFQRFNDRRDSTGLGTGLAVVKRIAERHGWRVHLDTVVGRGTTVVLELPPAGTQPCTQPCTQP